MNLNKRDNKQAQAPNKIILVAGEDIAVPASDTPLSAGPNSLNISHLQIGFLSKDENQITGPGLDRFVDGAGVPRQMIAVQGTPNSQNLRNVSAFRTNDQAYLYSGVIEQDKIISVHESCYAPGRYDMDMLMAFSTAVEVDREYRMSITRQSENADIEYSSQKLDESVATYAWNGVSADGTEEVVGNLVHKLNRQSHWVAGTKPWIVFAVNQAGGAGVNLSTVVIGDVIPFGVYGCVTREYVVDEQFINSLNIYYNSLDGAGQAAFALWTVEVLDPAVMGDNSVPFDSLLLVGLDEAEAMFHDESINFKTRVNMAFDLGHDRSDVSQPVPPVNSGRKWRGDWARSVAPYIHSLQNEDWGDGGPEINYKDSDIPVYIDFNGMYDAVLIEFYRLENALVQTEIRPHKAVILFPVQYDDSVVAYDAVTPVTGFSYVGINLTAEASIYGALQPFLANAFLYHPFETTYCRRGPLVTQLQ